MRAACRQDCGTLVSCYVLFAVALASSVPTTPPGQLSFYDHDPEAGEIGGVIEFIKASSEVGITHYVTYFGSSATARISPLVNLTADGTDQQYTIPENTQVPTVNGQAATHFLTFSANAQGEGAGESLEFHDRAVPATPPTSVAFSDVDYSSGSIGGTVTISRAADETGVTSYALYFGSGPSSLLLAVSTIPIQSLTGPAVHEFPNSTTVPTGATYLLAYTANDDGLSLVPVSVELVDHALPDQVAVGLSFVDNDLARGELSGLITILRATSEVLIESYAIYFAGGPTGPLISLLGAEAATGGNLTHLVPADTLLPDGADHLLVLTQNSFGTMSKGVSLKLIDHAVPIHPATSIAFTDTDPDGGLLGGPITVTAAANESDVTFYSIYFANSLVKPISSTPIASLSQGSSSLVHTLSQDTALPSGASRLLVLTGNEDGLMATGTSVSLVDKAVPAHPPQQVQFVDVDTDPSELGGTVTLFRAVDEIDITSYTAYFGSLSSSTRTAIGAVTISSPSSGILVFTVFSNTPVPVGATHVLAYSRNDDGEDQTGVSVPLLDASGALPAVSVTATSFIDFDMGLDLIGGALAWTEPSDTSGLTSYTAFLSVDVQGTMQQQVGEVSPVVGPLTYRTMTVQPGTQLNIVAGFAEYLILYANNNHGRGPGAVLHITDRAVPTDLVTSLAFADMDALAGSISGTVQWQPPVNPDGPTQFTGFVIYLAETASGDEGVRQGEVTVGTNTFAIPGATSLQNLTHVIVYTRNDNGEALVGAATAIVDRVIPQVAVSELQFFDQDLGTGEVGGLVGWKQPQDLTWVQHYVVYLDDSDDNETLPLGQSLVGSTTFLVPFNTAIGNFSSVTVVAANDVGEAPFNTSIPLLDRTVQSCPSTIGHGIQAERWRILAGEVGGSWRVQAIRFYEDSLCSHQIATLPAGWPRRPRLSAGSPFSSPHSERGLAEVFVETRTSGAWVNGTQTLQSSTSHGWTAPWPCPSGANSSDVNSSTSSEASAECAIGFDWESTAAYGPKGQVKGSGGPVLAVGRAVHCAEVVQSTTPGEFAETLSLQWFDETSSRYRTLLQKTVAGGGLTQMAYQKVLAAECASSAASAA